MLQPLHMKHDDWLIIFSIYIKNPIKEKVTWKKHWDGIHFFVKTRDGCRISAWQFNITVERIKGFQVPAAAHWGLVTIIRIGTLKHAFCDQGVQTRLSQFGVWGYATPKKKVIHNEGLKGSFLKACTSKSITILQAILQRHVRECNDLLTSAG